MEKRALFCQILRRAASNYWMLISSILFPEELKSSNFLHLFQKKNFSSLPGDEIFLHPQRQKQTIILFWPYILTWYIENHLL